MMNKTEDPDFVASWQKVEEALKRLDENQVERLFSKKHASLADFHQALAKELELMKTMPFWVKYHCGWLGTQIQRGYGVKLWFALKAYFKALFTIWQYNIVHFHTVPDKICLIIQIPVLRLLLWIILSKKKVSLWLPF